MVALGIGENADAPGVLGVVQDPGRYGGEMIIGFTGHRDKVAPIERLLQIAADYPGATWVTGGAVGFDQSVERFAAKNGIKNIIYRPNFKQFGRGAFHARNRQIVDGASLIVAMWDGRKGGGTVYTINYARKKGLEVKNLYDSETAS